jgi:hypothetical protein
MSQDVLGCYRVGEAKYYSKLAAIEAMQTTGIHLHWDFNEQVFDSYNWRHEPQESILELYRQRAQQLRDKYDYIILMYSGGADSHTALQSFLLNDIKIDEVCTWNNYEASKDRDDHLNSEVFRVVVPTITELKIQYAWLRHRMIDLADLTMEYYQQSENRFSWIYEINNYLGPNNAGRKSLGLRVKDWADIIHAGKSLCVVWGKEKLRLFHENQRFSCRFVDLISDAATVTSIAGLQPYTDELFFWTPDLPALVIKQAHLLKSYLVSHPDPAQLPFVGLHKSDLAYRTVGGHRFWLNNHGYHRVIYPNWCIETYSHGKPASIVISPRDAWFYKIPQSEIVRHNFQIGFVKVRQSLPDYWLNDPLDFSKGMKHCWSKDYFLE